VIILGAAIVLGAACKGEEKKEEKGFTIPPGWTPPQIDPLPEAGAKKTSGGADGWVVIDPGAEKLALVMQGVAKLVPAKDHRSEGMMWFTDTSDGLRVKVDIKNLTYMQQYSVRVHLLGDCSAPDFSSAGPPMNFQGSSLSGDPGPAAGLLGDLKAAFSGDAKGETTAPSGSLQGHYSILGRSVVLHATASTSSTSSDPLGPRIACGVIGIYANVDAPPPPPAPESAPSE